MNVSVVSLYKELLELDKEWKELFSKSDSSNIFTSWEWNSLWWKHFGDGNELLVLTVEDEGEIIGIAPLMAVPGSIPLLTRPVVTFFGGVLADYAGFLISRKRKEVLRSMIEFLQGQNRFGVINFGRICETSPDYMPLKDVIDSLESRCVVSVSNVNPALRIENTWDEYFRSVSKGVRQDIRTSHNRAKTEGGIIFEDHDEAKPEIMEQFFRLHKERQADKIGKSIFESKEVREFINELAASFSSMKWLDISILRLKDRVVSIVFAFRHNGEFYYWIPVFDSNFSKYSPGKVHLYYLLMQCFEQKFTRFDLMRGGEPYKLKWSNSELISYDVKIYRSYYYYLLDTAKSGFRKLVKHLFDEFPVIRNWLIALSKL